MTRLFRGQYFLVALLARCGVTAPSTPLDIETSVGTFRGFLNTTSNLEEWLGVPYAQPPIGNLRFKPPVALNPLPGITLTTHFGDACPQPVSANTVGVNISENCLVLNVFRPPNTSANSNLPVILWIHGGAYMTGASSDPQFNPAFLVNRSIKIGKPLVFISINYRLNTFGFLASSHVEPQDLNIGLLDQRQAMLFIKNEVSKFGGDPEKSVGGGAIEAALLYPSDTSLFRAGIIDSSTGPFKSAPFPAQYDAPGKPFSRLVEAVGCPLSSQSVSCLQAVPFDILLNVSNTLLNSILNQQLWQPAPGGVGNLVTERPSKKIASGDFLRVPIIWGTNLNEGTTFSKSVLGLPQMTPAEEAARFDEFIGELILDSNTLTTDVLNEINTLYPADDPSLGGAFNTGDSLFDRSEAWYADNMYLAPRRLYFNKAAPTQKLFAYFFTQFVPGQNRTFGVFHGSELLLIFGDAPPPGVTDLATIFTDAYLNFVSDLDPGSFWPQYNLKDIPVLQLMQDNITVIPDTFLVQKTDFLNSAEVLNEFEK
ncbi:hypothetical protein Clacol_002363 [Clathrus columnatus]|uniref:Carboxylesterase type B domain-containing protein n=1 Tax=Clathrus columnatus TaxID=1419009 RepID=A0AAV5A8C5_9AGAM|nr:hypothetical protein Clacol_002363 [Clathrus columnatus]